MHNRCLWIIVSRSTNNREQNMPTCSEVSTINVGDFSKENIHHLYCKISTTISKPPHTKAFSIIRASRGQPTSINKERSPS